MPALVVIRSIHFQIYLIPRDIPWPSRFRSRLCRQGADHPWAGFRFCTTDGKGR